MIPLLILILLLGLLNGCCQDGFILVKSRHPEIGITGLSEIRAPLIGFGFFCIGKPRAKRGVQKGL